jgi:hypothetical protein
MRDGLSLGARALARTRVLSAVMAPMLDSISEDRTTSSFGDTPFRPVPAGVE